MLSLYLSDDIPVDTVKAFALYLHIPIHHLFQAWLRWVWATSYVENESPHGLASIDAVA